MILSGIDPYSDEHFCNEAPHKRFHVETDFGRIEELRRRGTPTFTNDAHVARTTGLSLWSEDAEMYAIATGRCGASGEG